MLFANMITRINGMSLPEKWDVFQMHLQKLQLLPLSVPEPVQLAWAPWARNEPNNPPRLLLSHDVSLHNEV